MSRTQQRGRNRHGRAGRWALRQPNGRDLTALGVGVLFLGVASVLLLWFTPWMGRGLAWLLPHPALQLAVGVAMPAAIIGCVVRGVRRPFGEPYPPALRAALWGLFGTLWLLAPLGRGGGGAGAGTAAASSVHTLVLSCYVGWLVLAVTLLPLTWWDRRRRGRGWQRRPGAQRRHQRRGSKQEHPLPPRYVLRAAALPVGVVLVTVTIGLLVGA